MGWHIVSETRINPGEATRLGVVSLTDGSLAVGVLANTYVAGLGLLANGPSHLSGLRIDVGGAVSRPFTVDSTVARGFDGFGLSAGPDRTFAYSWTDIATGTNGPSNALGRKFVGAALPTGPVLGATGLLAGAETQTDLAVLSNRMSALVWTERTLASGDFFGNSIRGQLFTNSGLASGSVFQVNRSTRGDQAHADVTALSNGRFVVSWQDGGLYRAQIFASDPFGAGVTRVGLEITLGDDAPTITARSDGGFTVRTLDDAGRLFATAYSSKGAPTGKPTLVPERSGIDLGDGRKAVIAEAGPNTQLTVTDAMGEASGAPIFGGADPAAGSFRFAIPFGDGLMAMFRQTATREGLLLTPVSTVTVTIVDLTRYDGGAGSEQVLGGARDDRLDGGDGDDVIEGREGNDSLTGGGGKDVLSGGEGNDRLDGGPGFDRLDGGPGDDVLVHAGDGDVLDGGGGDDLLLLVRPPVIAAPQNAASARAAAPPVSAPTLARGGPGEDVVVVLGARDALRDLSSVAFHSVEGLRVSGTGRGGTTEVRLDAGQFGPGGLAPAFSLTGLDAPHAREMLRVALASGDPFEMRGWSFADWGGQRERIVLVGTAGADRVVASAWNDLVRGRGGDDRLHGAGRDDALLGGEGDDLLVGGRGADRLLGGPGADVFVLRDAADSGLRDAADRIEDFRPGLDHLDLSALPGAGRFIGSEAFHGRPGEVRAHHGRVQGDLDGDGAADWSLDLGPAAARLSEADFDFG
ncbi:M10 family metallopeptidase C-terminal domain-containing protein [Albimonas sp. CAU 1670]|uniref:calcium-binding protein n=1 Tax=Albimonas sp. CAU 1670 TaxID=3032599 RepID=UPI0023DA8338|nr:M10 family metallopeptidase C-terminal domain-containing protein [Albimonas sp. CAU 1670]MDF2231255.1 M10 family metallopeptidase C-terminal domain-containing protein [Albimonas sp. CAU 1670]